MSDELSVLAERLAQEDKARILNARCNAIILMRDTYPQQFDPRQLGVKQIKKQLEVMAVHYDCRYITGELYRKSIEIKSKVDPAIRRHTELLGEFGRKRFDCYKKLYSWEDLAPGKIEFDFRLSRVATAQAILELGGRDWINRFKEECAMTGINWLHQSKWVTHKNYYPLIERFYDDFFKAEAKSMEVLQSN